MPFSPDALWHDRLHALWMELFGDILGWCGNPRLRFLEIGCFEGRATVWLLEHVLTDPTSRIDVIDTFAGSPEHLGYYPQLWETFRENIEPWRGKVHVHAGTSQTVLRQLPGREVFDFVYVDGSHEAADVLTDAVLAWPLLKPGGVLLFDDVIWTHTEPDGRVIAPTRGMEAFQHGFEGLHDVIVPYWSGQFGVRKR